MDLPTYTNIWRIEKRLYKLYDFRLPMPLPISWIAVFCGITVPYVVVLAAIGVPFDHNLFFLYVLPPGVLTWVSTRPVLENKRLPALLGSQLRYVGEPRTWARMVPLTEKNEIRVYAKVWHRFPDPVEEPALAAASAAQATEDVTAAGSDVSRRDRDLERSPRGWRGRATPGLAPGQVLGRASGAAPEPGYASSSGRSGPRAWPHAGQTATGATAGAQAATDAPIPIRARAGQDRPLRLAARDDAQGLPGRGEPIRRPAWYDPDRRSAGARGTIPGEVLRGPAPSSAPPVAASLASPAEAGPASSAAAASADPAAMMPASRTAESAPGRPGRQPGWAGQTGAGRGSRGTDRRELARGNQPRGRARPLPIAATPIEVSHETHAAQGPAAVPLWGRPAMPRRATPPPPRPTAALGPAAVAAGAVPATPEPPAQARSHVLPPAPTQSAPAVIPITPPAPAATPAAPPAPVEPPPAVTPIAPAWPVRPAEAPAEVGATRADLAADPEATQELSGPAELPTQTELPAPPELDDQLGPPAHPSPARPEAGAQREVLSGPESSAPSEPGVLPLAPSEQSAAAAPAVAGPEPDPAVSREMPTQAELPAPAEPEASAEPVLPDAPLEAAPLSEAQAPHDPREPDATREADQARVADPPARPGRREVPSIERALSGPGRIDSWQRRVRVVPGGQGPGQRDRESLDRDRARLKLSSPHRIVFLGCTSGAGQTITALMTGQVLAALRETPVAAIDLNPGHGSLARQAQGAPALTVAALLAGADPAPSGRAANGRQARLDVIAGDADPAAPTVPDERDYSRLAEQASRRYQLTLIDPGASEVTRILGVADQLVLVAPASADAPRSLGMTQEWLSSHGHGELSGRAVTVVNGVSKASMGDVEQAEAVARGRCRAIVRIPWDDTLSAGTANVSSLRPQARHAYTALAGVLIAGLAARPVPRRVLQ